MSPSSRALWTSSAIGFSSSTSFPALRYAAASETGVAGGVAIVTASTRSSQGTEPGPSATAASERRNSDFALSTLAGVWSITPTTSTSDRRFSHGRWRCVPTQPSPTTATRRALIWGRDRTPGKWVAPKATNPRAFGVYFCTPTGNRVHRNAPGGMGSLGADVVDRPPTSPDRADHGRVRLHRLVAERTGRPFEKRRQRGCGGRPPPRPHPPPSLPPR